MDWILPILDLAVIEPVTPGLWKPSPPVPDWLGWAGGDLQSLGNEFPMLETFLLDAMPFWDRGQRGRLRSAIWKQKVGPAEAAFRADAIFGDGKRALLLQRIDEEAEEMRRAYQGARDLALTTRKFDKQRAQAELIGRRKDDFLASMSHELRTPLNSVVGFATLLEQQRGGELTGKQQSFVSNILTASRHLLALINEVLDLARIDAGRLDLCFETFKFGDCVAEVLAILGPQAAGRHVAIDAAGVDIEIFADRLRWKQILLNLVGNAVKFAPEQGSVLVEASSGDAVYEVAVSDDGPGIPPQKREAIFDRFSIASVHGAPQESHGLGLAITKRLVEAHGGLIRIETASMGGARFVVTVPCADRKSP